ncbi:DUF3857 domain-containing protein [bacterium]|nr:DUF3857 domain-containing protein [bacterium]
MQKHNIIIIIILTILKLGWGDVIYLNDGEEYEGRLVGLNETHVSLEVFSGDTIELPLSGLYRLELENLSKVELIDFIDDTLIHNLWGVAAQQFLGYDLPYVNLFENIEYHINPDSTWERRERKIQIIINDVGKEIANKAFYYLAQDETIQIVYVRVVQEDGKVYYIRESALKDESINYNLPEYDNLWRKKIAIRGINIGSIIDYQIIHKMPKISAARPFLIKEYFRDEELMLHKKVNLIYPPNFEVIYDTFNIDSLDSSFSQKLFQKNGWKIIQWDIFTQPRLQYEPFTPPVAYFFPGVIATNLKNWTDTGTEYYNLIHNNTLDDSSLTKLLNNILYDRVDTLRAIYNYVLNDIKFQTISLSEFSYQPRSLEKVLSSKSGGYLDKAYLLYVLYHSLGYKSHFLLVNDQEHCPLKEKTPDISQFDYAMVELEYHGDRYYLAPFWDRIPFGFIPGRFQGTKALRIDAEASRLIDMPLSDYDKEGEIISMDATLHLNGTLEIIENISYRGEKGSDFRDNKRLNKDELDQFVEQLIHQVHPNSELVSYFMSDLSDLYEEVQLNINYIIPDYILWGGEDLIILNLPGIDYSAYDVGIENKQYPLYFDDYGSYNKEIVLNYPREFKVYYLPPDVCYESSLVEYHARFEGDRSSFLSGLFSGKTRLDRLVFRDRFCLKKLTTPADEYKNYRECIKTRASLSGKSIILTK